MSAASCPQTFTRGLSAASQQFLSGFDVNDQRKIGGQCTRNSSRMRLESQTPAETCSGSSWPDPPSAGAVDQCCASAREAHDSRISIVK